MPGFALQAERPEFSTIIRDMSRARCNENTSPNDEVDAQAIAQLPVPEGVRLSQFLYWAYDTDPDLDLTFDVYETCLAPGAGLPGVTLIAHGFTILSIGPYFGFISLNDLTADTRNCSYSVQVTFALVGEECVAGGLEVQKLQVVWTRQVSPASGGRDVRRRADRPPVLPVRRGPLEVGHHRRLQCRAAALLPRRAADARTDGGVSGERPGPAMAVKEVP